MLKILRKKGLAKKILWVLATVIIISFTFWGTQSGLDDLQKISYAGKIFNKKVSFDQFREKFIHTENQAILRYGEEFFKIRNFINLESETWDRLILAHEAKRRKLTTTDQEVIETIQKYPFFQRNGSFDNLLYNDILRDVFKIRPSDFETGVRDTLTFAKLFEEETRSTTIPEEEILKTYQQQKERLQVSYILFPLDPYKKDISFNEEEAKNYFEQYKQGFVIPLQINLEYIHLAYTDTTPPEEKNKLLSQMNTIVQEFKKNPDFKAVAAQYNLPVEESGFFSQEQPNLKIGFSFELLQKAFVLEPNMISDPIETTQGYYLIKLKEKKEQHLASYEEVKDKIKEIQLNQKAQEITKTKVLEQLNDIQEKFKLTPSVPFAQFAKDLGFTVEQTPLFARGDYLPSLGLSKEFEDMAFSLNDQNKLALSPVATAKGLAVIYLDKKEAPTKEAFEKEKDTFKETLIGQKKMEHFNDFMANLRIKSNLEDNISKLNAQKSAQKN